MTSLHIAVIQCSLSGSKAENIERVEHWVREAAKQGATLIVTPELFETPYFPQTQDEACFELAADAAEHPTIAHFSALAKSLKVSLPVSFFERSGPHHYNSVAMLDSRGQTVGTYRKSHIPDGPGYTEKFYFRPGDSGFQAFDLDALKVGVGICWDQWFPEAARSMALLGAEVLLYPTAIGSEPAEPESDTAAPWRRVMVGHAVANAMPVAAANRIGVEGEIRFYGTSFIADWRGEVLAEVPRDAEGVAIAQVDLAEAKRYRASWGFFRDRRPDLYQPLVSKNG